LHACLLYFSARSLFRNGQIAVLATILILLTLLTLLSTAALVHIDCKYDPD
jgi:4-amino-4-deoxy-L-arabinose transferase-like glycosyltransferase